MHSATLQQGRRTTRARLAASACLLLAQATFAQVDIPSFSSDLEREMQPWCQPDCARAVPFTVTYRSGDRVLVFIASPHVFTRKNKTTAAIDAAFKAVSPAIAIVEGFPTLMGENPAPLVEQARQMNAPDAPDFSRGEGMYTLSRALAHNIPFVGGEPTRAEQVVTLQSKGFTPSDIGFAYLVGTLAQALRSGTLSSTADPKLEEVFNLWAKTFADQYQLQPPTLAEFSARYRTAFAVELAQDRDLLGRADPGSNSLVARLNQVDMNTRDVHLFMTIKNQVERRRRVLVVYGSSHWNTLGKALEQYLGKPTIKASH